MTQDLVPASPAAPPSTADLEESTTHLVRQAFEQTRELVRLEVALAREDLRADLARAKIAAMALGSAAGALLVSLAMFLVAIALAVAIPWLLALVFGAFFALVGAVLAYAGWRRLPVGAGAETRERLASDFEQLKEHIV